MTHLELDHQRAGRLRPVDYDSSVLRRIAATGPVNVRIALVSVIMSLAVVLPAQAKLGPLAAMESIVADARGHILAAAEALGEEEATARAVVHDGILAHVDATLMARYALGTAWARASEAQRRQVSGALAAHLSRIGGIALHRNTESVLRLARTTRIALSLAQRIEARAEVIARLEGGPYDGFAVTLWLHQRGDQWRIFDVRVAGIGLLRLIRADLQGALANRSIDAVIDQLRSPGGGAAQ